MVKCPRCLAINEEDARFCDCCGASLLPSTGGAPRSGIARQCVLVGAGDACDLVMGVSEVSRCHALVVREGVATFVIDLWSTNGTVVDDRPVQPGRRTVLQPSSSLRLGGIPLDMGMLEGRLREAAGRVWFVGRDPDADMVVDVPAVSAWHLCVIRPAREPTTLLVADLGSSNGTRILSDQGECHPVKGAVELRADDELFLGSYRLDNNRLRQELGTPIGSVPKRTGFAVQARFTGVSLLLGRATDCDVVVPLPQVSSHHARLKKLEDGRIGVEDLGSTNGTFLNGQRIRSATLGPGDRLSLGSVNVAVDFDKSTLHVDQMMGMIRLDAVDVGRVVTHRKTGAPLTLLDGVSCSVYPSELVGLMGPSGAGKTTMMLAMNGYECPDRGSVLLNGEDLYANFDRFRGLIGYVPQDDVFHTELTVFEALYYTARLRLPRDTTDEEITSRIEKVLGDLNLREQRDMIIGSVEQKVLSGGQRKRVNLAMELVTDPPLLFLDEPTSGLSALDTREVVVLLKRLTEQGRTIVMTIHQPSAEVYAMLDQVMVLAKGGRTAYYGPADPDSYEYFQSARGTPDKIMEALDREKPEDLQAQYASSPHCDSYVHQRQGRNEAPAGQDRFEETVRQRCVPASGWRQWITLLRRYAILKVRDSSNALFIALQAPIVGAVLGLLFHDARKSPQKRALPLFVMGIAIVFFGMFNASREVVREQAVFRRERMVNLRVDSYLMSKFCVLGLIGLLQALILIMMASGFVGIEGNKGAYLLTLGLTALAATAMGLLLSSLVKSSEAAMAVVPMILIPQIVLSGFLIPLSEGGKEYVEWLAFPMLSRWSMEALLEVERGALAQIPAEQWRQAFLVNQDLTPERLGVDMAVILLMTIVFLVASAWVVARRGRRGAPQ